MELLDVYDNNGKKTGKVVDRGEDLGFLSKDEHIAVAIIFIENSNNQFLIQKTSKEKGGLYASTGGHVDHGEDPYTTIKREVLEELGVDVSNDNIIDLGYLLIDFPIRFIFYLKKDIDINDIILQKEEVDNISYMSIDKIRNIINNDLMNKGHAKAFEYVLERIKEDKKDL